MQVAVVTVGDELLAGETANTNATWLAQRLTERGARVERITTVPDRVSDIARVVNEYHAEYDAVVVTGGLGPTHDDVTTEAVAAAFGRELTTSSAAQERLADRGYAREDLTDGTADIPAGARPLHNETGVAPGCVIGSVYVLPGVPGEMKPMFEAVADEFDGLPDHVVEVVTTEPESALLDRLRTVRDRFDVRVGSYPGDRVRLRVRAPDPTVADAAAAWLRDHVETPTTETEPPRHGEVEGDGPTADHEDDADRGSRRNGAEAGTDGVDGHDRTRDGTEDDRQ